jgi:site-specific recombinase XerD
MMETNAIENWLNTVAFSHSDSKQTRTIYKLNIQKFLTHAGTTADQILQEYDNCKNDKKFKQKWTPIIMSLIGKMRENNYSPLTQNNVITAIKSFYRYNSLPIGFIPSGKQYIRFHNRPITKEEINLIIRESQPREKAYYSLMKDSGLRPQTISKLKIGDLENLLDENTPIPCPIIIRQEITKGKYSEYFTFTGEESIKHIKEYLKRQRKQPLITEEYLFTMENKRTPVNPDVINHTFARTIKTLRTEKILDFKTESQTVNGKTETSNKIKLYSLRKYYRNNNHADWDYKNFWMGHLGALGADKHYIDTSTTPENIEKHRQIYKEKAMPYLKIETKTPDQHEQTMTKLETENKELKNRLDKMEQLIEIFSQVEYQRTINLMSKPLNERRKELLLTPKAYKIIRETKTNKKPSELLMELNKKLEDKMTFLAQPKNCPFKKTQNKK